MLNQNLLIVDFTPLPIRGQFGPMVPFRGQDFGFGNHVAQPGRRFLYKVSCSFILYIYFIVQFTKCTVIYLYILVQYIIHVTSKL